MSDRLTLTVVGHAGDSMRLRVSSESTVVDMARYFSLVMAFLEYGDGTFVWEYKENENEKRR